jgi:hypothetical protein
MQVLERDGAAAGEAGDLDRLVRKRGTLAGVGS